MGQSAETDPDSIDLDEIQTETDHLLDSYKEISSWKYLWIIFQIIFLCFFF
jgi:hypothetical protein